MVLIEMRDVSKAFLTNKRKAQAQVVLEHANLSIEEGEFVSLIGPSGCGKTVSLSMMAGFLAPTQGEVLFRGAPIESPGPERGVVFQEYSLFPWLSVLQNVMFALENATRAQGRSWDSKQGEARSRVALAQVGLEDKADMRPNTLSGGMKQRVAIARLLAMDSEVYLMDEPFSALDEQTRGRLDESLRRLWLKKRKTVVFVTHNISEAVAVSSRIVLFSGSPGTILREWRLPEDMDRCKTSAEVTALSAEILDCMPFDSASFGNAE